VKHKWHYEEKWMETTAGKFCGGFSTCERCDLMRFSVAGHPPQHWYVTREHLALNQGNTSIRPGARDVRPIAGACPEVVGA
jgi:hypothetical protein